MTATFLDQKRAEIQERLDEIKPLVEEARRLEAALAAIDSTAPKKRGRPRKT